MEEILPDLNFPDQLADQTIPVDGLIDAIAVLASNDVAMELNFKNVRNDLDNLLKNHNSFAVEAMLNSIGNNAEEYWQQVPCYQLSARIVYIALWQLQDQNATADDQKLLFQVLFEKLKLMFGVEPVTDENKTTLARYVEIVNQLRLFYEQSLEEKTLDELFKTLLKYHQDDVLQWQAVIVELVETLSEGEERTLKQEQVNILTLQTQLETNRLQQNDNDNDKHKNPVNVLLDDFSLYAIRAVQGETTEKERSTLIKVGQLMNHWFENGDGDDAAFKTQYDDLNKELKLSRSKLIKGLGITLIILGLCVVLGSIVALAMALSPAMALAAADLVLSFGYYTLVGGVVMMLGGAVVNKLSKPTWGASVFSYFNKAYKPQAQEHQRADGYVPLNDQGVH